ncbi:ankyrin repeat domain-containing protein 7-like [Lingula anatina]|uniref:Ankyrin repeat domain-containing protein 7-like n=1 Tax=Lingula anatina TaxID=7574 RepID=A0A1S3IZA6_LINAN|nr:ankyrin repeat domain-containing protein 7-like [Lingula anatina]|eukprot:XP_013403535.1 ankyrin repeat domain-containing protein 7-like [Lingula anatina]
MSQLDLALYCGDTDGVKRLLSVGSYDVNGKDKFGGSSLDGLLCTGLKGNAEVAKQQVLLDSGAELNAQDSYGRTPLHRAACTRDENTVRLLLERGADPNITNKDGRTPLHAAAKKGCRDIVKLLLGRGADPNIKDKTHLFQKVMTAVSEQVSVRDIRFLARKQLGILNSKLENIRCQNPNDAREEAFQILWEWMKTKAGTTVHNLFKALKDQQLNACLDTVRNKYSSLLNDIWAMAEDKFQKFLSSLPPAMSSTSDVTLSNTMEMNLRCYVSDDLNFLYVPLESFNANAKGNDKDSVKAVVKYRFAGKAVCRNEATFVKMVE